MADEAYHIGAAQATKSYLNMATIIEVAKRCGGRRSSGYGFLSENAGFVDCVPGGGSDLRSGPDGGGAAGDGEKTAARRTAQEVCAIVPGAMSDVEDDETNSVCCTDDIITRQVINA